MYYDRQGQAITLEQWAEIFEKQDRRVACTVLPNGYMVSTVHLGLDHRFGEGPPLIFETMVFPCTAEGEVADYGELDGDRYSTEAEALAGHEQMCTKWQAEPARV